jgi:hypothetical protein
MAPLSLHDSVALGEVELGLSATGPCKEEVQRLPILLRLLSRARPPTSTKDSGEDDQVIQQAVNLLEDRAAIYSEAEGMEVVACHLAPFCCRRFLQKGRTNNKQQKSPLEKPTGKKKDNLHMASDVDEEDDFSEDDDEMDIELPLPSRSSRRDSLTTAGEDSLEATATKTLLELSLLVKESLKPPKTDDEGVQNLMISIDDSMLAEAPQSTSGVGGGGTMGSDLRSVVSALMFHAPFLGHQRVAVRCRS